jgi:hypothetical protein
MGTYWDGNGKYQEWSDKLEDQVPMSGRAEKLHIDLVRNISNCYYDHFNNGNCNWGNKSEQFAHIEYHADALHEAALAEGIENIRSLLSSIRSPLDADFAKNLFYCGEDAEDLEENWEKLADIIIGWAWKVEQSLPVPAA